MNRFKKIAFFVLFFITLSHVIEDVIYYFHESQFTIENMKHGNDCHKNIASELENHDEDVKLDDHSLYRIAPLIGKIEVKNSFFLNKHIDSFWQPPKIS
jgi:hypothetical protein